MAVLSIEMVTTITNGCPLLLNYLFTNFYEETQFVDAFGTTIENLRDLFDAKVFPALSYVYNGKGKSVSFMTGFTDQQTYQFYLRGHTD